MPKKKHSQPFWEAGLNPITMWPASPKRYREFSATVRTNLEIEVNRAYHLARVNSNVGY